MGCFLYILCCSDGSYYTGTDRGEDLATRISEHNNSHYPDAYTAQRRPVALAYAEEFASIDDAIAAERRIKGWSRAKKEALMRSDWQRLIMLAKRPSMRLKK